MTIGILDLFVIYALPLVLLGSLLTVSLFILYVVVRKDIGKLAFAEDVRYNIRIRKQPVSFSTVAQIMLFDNGVQAAFFYRLARFLHLRGLHPLATALHKIGKYVTNVDLPPTAKVGPGVVFLHCCNIVIGPYIEIGSHVVFRPFVALRGWGTVKIEDGVKTGLQTCVMDCVTMGKNSESAPGAIVTRDVPADHIAFGTPATKMVPRPETKLKGVVIDLENVLLEPSPVLHDALRAALGKNAKQPPDLQNLDLPPENIIDARAGDTPGAAREILEKYMEVARARAETGLRVLPEGRMLLETIRERGLKVAVISKQPDALASAIVESLGLAPLVDAVCGADAVLSEWKPQPWIIFQPMRQLKLGVERVIFVGGSTLDLQAGTRAALRTYWVPRHRTRHRPRKGLVDVFPDLQAVLAEFSRARLPPTV